MLFTNSHHKSWICSALTFCHLAWGATPASDFPLAEGVDRPDCVVFSSDLNLVVALRASGHVTVQDTATGKEIGRWTALGEPNAGLVLPDSVHRRLLFLPGDESVLVAQGSQLTVHQVRTGTLLKRVAVAPAPVAELALSGDGRVVAGLVRTTPPTTWVWRLEDGHLIHGADSHAGLLSQGSRRRRHAMSSLPKAMPTSGAMALNPEGSLLAIDRGYEEVDLWQLPACTSTHFLVGPSGLLSSSSILANEIAFLPDQRLAVVFAHESLVLFPPDSGPRVDLVRPSAGQPPHQFEMHALAVADDGKRLVAGGLLAGPRRAVFEPTMVYDVPLHAHLKVWDATTGRAVDEWSGSTNEVFGVVGLDRTGPRVGAVGGAAFGRIRTGTLQKHPRMPIASAAPPSYTAPPLRVRIWNMRAKAAQAER